jgi:predicted phage tail protein
MITDILILVVGLSMILFGLSNLLTPERRKFASEDIKGGAEVAMGLFLIYFWYLNVSIGNKGSGGGYY